MSKRSVEDLIVTVPLVCVVLWFVYSLVQVFAFALRREEPEEKLLRSSGIATIVGDGSTTEFEVKKPHGLASDKVAVSVSCTRPTTAPPSYIFGYVSDEDGDGFRETVVITVRFDVAPADGEVVEVYWIAEVVS